ncbi:MAG: alpha/beta hydrolase [Gemmatimonadota bacterium]
MRAALPSGEDPHGGQPPAIAGEPLDRARAAMLLVHGRGAGPRDILSLTAELDPAGFAYLAPRASGSSWYPESFLAPPAANEPWLSSALRVLGRALSRIEDAGVPVSRTILLGFSQGACLALEFAARNARRYGGVVGLSGGLIGPPGAPREYAGSFARTPVFLGCSDRDPHIPAPRVRETADVLRAMDAEVTDRLYPAMSHTVNADELRHVSAMMERLLSEPPP